MTRVPMLNNSNITGDVEVYLLQYPNTNLNYLIPNL